VALGSADGTKNGAQALGARSLAIGTNALSGAAVGNLLAAGDAANDTIAIGTDSTAQGNNSVAIGKGASTSFHTNSVAIGAGATASADNQIVLGTSAETVVTPGNATVGGTLAVTGATTLTGALTANGGISTTTLSTSGLATLNSLSVTGATTLTGALTANGGISTTTLATTGNATVGGTLAVTGTTTTNGITNTGAITTTTLTTTGNATIGGNASVGGTLNMNGNKITNVANGTNPGDAVNFGQLQETRKILAGGIASATAMANIPLVDQNKQFAVGVGLGGYDGQTSIAVGASYRINPTTVLRGSVGGGSANKTAVGVGLGISW